MFAVPGAFTPTCSSKHLPGFVEKADEFKAKGVDTIACVSVNDAFVMDAWGKSAGIDGKILMLADGSAEFAKVSAPAINVFGMSLSRSCSDWKTLHYFKRMAARSASLQRHNLPCQRKKEGCAYCSFLASYRDFCSIHSVVFCPAGILCNVIKPVLSPIA